MGQAGSQPGEPRARRVHTLPHEPLRLAPKVLPSLTESPRLRSTDNGAILHSGGTISGRRPGSILQESRIPHGHVHSNVYRSRSAGGGGEIDIRSRERDPLHRSHTNLDFRHNDSNGMNKRFGSEPDLRVEEEQPKSRNNNNKHFRKKYKAPQPPSNHLREGSSPDSREGNANLEPQRKLRLFRTRNETKKLNGHMDSKIPVYKNSYTDFKSLDLNDHFGRRYKSPCKDKEQCVSYVESKDMVQSSTSLQKEERLLQDKQDYRKARTDRISGCRAKTSKTNETEAWKTPLLNKNFRYSERFKNDQPILRREKTFDDTLTTSERENESPRALHEKRTKALGEELTNKLSPLGQRNQPLRKSLPSLLNKSNEEKDEFQEELKKATSRIRKELGNKLNVSENTSQNVKTQKPNPSKPMTPKVKESSPKVSKPEPKPINTRRPLCRVIEKTQNNKIKNDVHYKSDNKENKKVMPDRGQASGKESTPEHSPTRKKETSSAVPEKQRPAPSKQFYFGMIESKKTEPQDHLKDFPGLGSPIIEEFTNFHLIEKKLLGYHEEDEMEKFNEKFKEDCKRNLSSESALSSDGSEEGSEGSLGITLRLRPTLPKKLPTNARFSPTSAWRQLASLDAHFAETQPLAVEIKMSGDLSPESSPRSEQSADKSGDSGISGDHGHSDHRIDSPGHVAEAAWTPQQDLGDSSSDGTQEPLRSGVTSFNPAYTTYNPGAPFSFSLPRDDKGKQLQQGFNSLQKLRKSVSGALGAALGSRRFDLEHEPMLEEPEQNWFLTKSAPNSLSNPLLYHQPLRTKVSEDIGKEEPSLISEKGPDENRWRSSYVKWGGHVMYLPPAPDQPLSMLGTAERPIRSKSSGCLEASARAARAALAGEMRERERSASPDIARAVPARVEPVNSRTSNAGRGKRFTFQSTVRQLERRRIAEKLSREADLKEQQRRTELEAMRRVEEEFQRKRAREKANIRQQLRLVSSGANSMPPSQHSKSRDEPDGSCRGSPAPDRTREPRVRHGNSSEGSGRSKSSTPIRSVELSEWRTEGGARVYRDWAAAGVAAHAHPPACARMPATVHSYAEGEAFSGSPRSDNYRLEFARGRSPRTPRPPRLLPHSPASSTSGSELSLRQPIKIREPKEEDAKEPAIVPTLRPSGPSRTTVAIR